MSDFIDEIITILNLGFMQRAFLGGSILAIMAPMIGQFMVVKRYSPISDTAAHIALVGIAAGLIFGLNPTLSAMIVAILAGVLIEFLRQKRVVYGESALVIALITSLSLLSILKSVYSFDRSLDSLLFGSILITTSTTIWWMLGAMVLVIGFITTNYKKLLSLSLDEELAKTQGINIDFYNYSLIVISSIVVTVGIDLVGGLLVGGLMIVPVVSSIQFNLGFRSTMILSIILAIISVWFGLLFGWFLNLPSGASISFLSVIIFTISIILNRLNLN